MACGSQSTTFRGGPQRPADPGPIRPTPRLLRLAVPRRSSNPDPSRIRRRLLVPADMARGRRAPNSRLHIIPGGPLHPIVSKRHVATTVRNCPHGSAGGEKFMSRMTPASARRLRHQVRTSTTAPASSQPSRTGVMVKLMGKTERRRSRRRACRTGRTERPRGGRTFRRCNPCVPPMTSVPGPEHISVKSVTARVASSPHSIGRLADRPNARSPPASAG